MIEQYLSDLLTELRRRRVSSGRRLAEVREHLLDAVADGVRSGLSPDEANRAAIERVGDVRTVAEHFAEDARAARRHWEARIAPFAMPIAVFVGLLIAFADSRPHWDDAGITVISMLAWAFLLGCALPRQPWRWGLAIGVWIPLFLIVRTGNAGAAVMFVLVLFPMAGAYGGAAIRKSLS